MYGKIEIKGNLEVKTGMHIGGSSAFAAIGAVDSPVMRDSLTNLPFIPGSSLKGKLRYLLAEKYNDRRTIIGKHNQDNYRVLRLFGSSENDEEGNPIKSRLYFSDMFLSNDKDLEEQGISVTEVKYENTIDRLTAVANPRQIERVIRGASFDMSIIYNVAEENDITEDLQLVKEAIELLKYDYLGGHGSRGYGRVEIQNLEIIPVVGDFDKEKIDKFKEVFR